MSCSGCSALHGMNTNFKKKDTRSQLNAHRMFTGLFGRLLNVLPGFDPRNLPEVDFCVKDYVSVTKTGGSVD